MKKSTRWEMTRNVASFLRADVPLKVIFDTDMWSDIDDLLALAMLHALADRSEAELLAVTSTTDDPWTGPFIHAVNTFYGRGDIPIGCVRNGVTATQTVERFPWLQADKGFVQHLCELRHTDGSPVFPHAFTPDAAIPEAVALLRRALAAQADGSVIMIQVGFSTNLARLLTTAPDSACGLTGVELVRRKVRFLSVMAGDFLDSAGQKRPVSRPEFNLVLDVPSAQCLFDKWPTRIVVSGVDVGTSMRIKGSEIELHYGHVAHHPVLESYRFADKIYRSPDAPPGVLHDHGTFDLTSVLFAVRPRSDYFTLSAPGKVQIRDDGSLVFDEAADGTHHYLIVEDHQRARTLEAMTLLSSQPSRLARHVGDVCTAPRACG